MRIFFLSMFCPRIGPFEESSVRFTVWPSDCDINLHMNNGRYLTIMDLGRTHLLSQLRLLWRLPGRRWFPVVGGVHIDYYRSLDPLQQYDLVTQLLAYDEKWFYLEQRFERQGRVMARAHLRALFLGPGGKVNPVEVVTLAMGELIPSPLHEVTEYWKGSADGVNAAGGDFIA